MDDTLVRLRADLRAFAAAREWDQFHSPKNLAIAISVEAGELLEHFQWVPDGLGPERVPHKLTKVEEELADVLLYVIRMADVLGVDLATAAERKIAANELKYPVEKSRGNARKYTDF